MSNLLDFFESLFDIFSTLWKYLFLNIRTIIENNMELDYFEKLNWYKILPNWLLDTSFINLISVGFISFLLIWALIKVFTNIL